MLSWFSETPHELQNSTDIYHTSLGVIKHFAIFGAPHLIKLLGDVSSHGKFPVIFIKNGEMWR